MADASRLLGFHFNCPGWQPSFWGASRPSGTVLRARGSGELPEAGQVSRAESALDYSAWASVGPMLSAGAALGLSSGLKLHPLDFWGLPPWLGLF